MPTVYVYGASGFLYAMNASDGTDVWPPAVVAIPSTTKNDYYAWGSPLVSRGNIYVGISSQCDVPLVRAGLDVFNRSTGALENTFWTDRPATGARASGPVRRPMAPQCSPPPATARPPATALRSCDSIGALSQLLGMWQVPVSERVFDSDFGASPGIWTSAGTEMVGACNKNGNFYAFDADSLSSGPVWQDQIGDPFKGGPGQCDAAPVTTARRSTWPATQRRSAGPRTGARSERLTPRPAPTSGRRGSPPRSSAAPPSTAAEWSPPLVRVPQRSEWRLPARRQHRQADQDNLVREVDHVRPARVRRQLPDHRQHRAGPHGLQGAGNLSRLAGSSAETPPAASLEKTGLGPGSMPDGSAGVHCAATLAAVSGTNGASWRARQRQAWTSRASAASRRAASGLRCERASCQGRTSSM